MKYAFVFPGQGSQSVGMGQDLLEHFSEAKEIFGLADDTLGKSLSKICFEGPSELLTQTENAQPALFTVSAIIFSLLKKEGIMPDYVAGHSLGELTAYFAAGVYDLATALRVIQARGNALAASYPSDKSAMALPMPLDAPVTIDTFPFKFMSNP